MVLILADANTACLPAFYVASITSKQGQIRYIYGCEGVALSRQLRYKPLFLMAIIKFTGRISSNMTRRLGRHVYRYSQMVQQRQRLRFHSAL
jgi:hypothetical protein